jgi:hypothetical protein
MRRPDHRPRRRPDLRRRWRALAPLVLSAVAARTGGAQVLQDGWGSNPFSVVDYDVKGAWTCGPNVPASGTCAVAGNTLTLGDAGGSMRFTFTGLTGSVVATKVRTRVQIGYVDTEVGGAFTLAPNAGALDGPFQLALSRLMPRAPHAAIRLNAGPFDLARIDFLPTRRYLDWSNARLDRPFEAETGRFVVSAAAQIVPEPATWATLGTGLLALGLGATRRRRSVEQRGRA